MTVLRGNIRGRGEGRRREGTGTSSHLLYFPAGFCGKRECYLCKERKYEDVRV